MLSNVIYLQDMNDRMILAMDEGRQIELAWLVGRTTRVLLVVPPLRVIDDYDFDEDNDDFNRL